MTPLAMCGVCFNDYDDKDLVAVSMVRGIRSHALLTVCVNCYDVYIEPGFNNVVRYAQDSVLTAKTKKARQDEIERVEKEESERHRIDEL